MRSKNLTRLALGSALGLSALLAYGTPVAQTADEPQMQRLALCQDSWFDWKDDEVRMARFGGYFQAGFDAIPDGGGAFAPKAALKLLGHAVTQVYPQSVGMGVGFSVAVNADFSQARAAIEKQLGKPMACTSGDGMRACELKVGAKKTAVLMTPLNNPAKTSLVGCYYFYQQ